jgi:acetylornithine deacetylase
VCGPGDIAQAHQPNEFILASQITACEGFMRRMVEWASQ